MALFKKKKKEPNKIYTLDELNIGTEGMSEEEIARLEAEAVLEKYDKESAYRNKIKGPVAFVLGLIMIAFSLFQIYTPPDPAVHPPGLRADPGISALSCPSGPSEG